MGTSTPASITYICERIIKLKPKSVLDIGIGFGKYGFLSREYTDVYHGNQLEWKTRIDGIEGFERYVTKLQRIIYDNIYIGDATEIIKTLGMYDLILSVDMLEHLEKDQGIVLLHDIREHSKQSIVSLPMYPSKQRYGKYKNKFGPHRSIWIEEELTQFGKVLKFEDFNKQGKKEERVFLVEIKGI
jgi:hypothetical protein